MKKAVRQCVTTCERNKNPKKHHLTKRSRNSFWPKMKQQLCAEATEQESSSEYDGKGVLYLRVRCPSYNLFDSLSSSGSNSYYRTIARSLSLSHTHIPFQCQHICVWPSSSARSHCSSRSHVRQTFAALKADECLFLLLVIASSSFCYIRAPS
jgi:hypothetical protein